MINYNDLPESPGVYLFLGEKDRVLYVGKAKNLKKRVSQYFTHDNSNKTSLMLSKAVGLKHLVTDNEVEALLLECSLIKNNKPSYNVRLKDDKSYPFVRITNEDYPSIFVTRRVVKDGSTYFGPYTNAYEIKKSIRFIRGLMGIRTCIAMRKGGCLNYHMGRCVGPCKGSISIDDYKARVELAVKFLNGNYNAIITNLKKKLLNASKSLNYELAAGIRDNIKAINGIMERQKMVLGGKDFDALSVCRLDRLSGVILFFVRGGKVSGSEFFLLSNAAKLSDEDLLSNFIKLFYYKKDDKPKELLVNITPSDSLLISDAFNLRFKLPKKGKLRDLMQLVVRNGEESIREELLKEKGRARSGVELREALSLSKTPHKIEGIDISNIAGTLATGSIVRFKDGVPDKNGYRRFKIKGVVGPNDYEMMREVIYRRFKNHRELPDLLVIDGGKGQLNACLGILGELKLKLPCVAIAKSFEHLFIKNKDEPVILSGNSSALHLIQRVRDEAHRFARAYHKLLRTKKAF